MKEDLLCRWDPNARSSGAAAANIECTLSAEAYEAAELAARRQFNGTLVSGEPHCQAKEPREILVKILLK